MPFAGSLEYLAVPDVLQLLHVSRRTGTLRVQKATGEAGVLHLREGAIVGAHHPSKAVTVGSTLIELGAVSVGDVEAALGAQRTDGHHEPLVATLVTMGKLDRQVGYKALQRLIEETVIELVSWREGRFEFDLADQGGNDEFRHLPDAMGEAVSLDTQSALMDALRIIDERNRATAEALLEPEAIEPPEATQPRKAAEPSGAAGAPASPARELAPPAEAPPGPGVSPRGEPPPGPETPTAPARPPTPRAMAVPAFTSVPGTPSPAPVVTAPAALAAALAPPTLRESPSEGAPVATPAPHPPVAPGPGELGEDEELLVDSLDAETSGSRRSRDRAQLLCADTLLKNSLRAACHEKGIELFASDYAPDHVHRIEAALADELVPALVVDLSVLDQRGELQRAVARVLEQVVARFPEVPIVALARPGPAAQQRAFDLGATAVLPRPDEAQPRDRYMRESGTLVTTVVASLRGFFGRRAALARRPLDSRRLMAALKQRVREIRSNQASSEISLVVLRFVADMFDRCVIFLARRDDIIGLGAFGVDAGHETLSPVVLKLKIPVVEGSAIHTVVHEGKLVHGTSDDPVLREFLYPRIGTPDKPEMVLMPLRAEDRTAAVIYADFGMRPTAPVETDALEVLADHAGLALELALHRGRAPRGEPPKPGPGPA